MKKAVVTFSRVGKSFSGQPALTDFTLSIYDGEFVTLLGPSGCGKTTVLRLIGGFESCERGVIRIEGVASDRTPPERRPVNTVFQNYALFPHMTVYDNVAFGLRMAGIAETRVAESVREALALTRMSDMGARRPAELSGGQQQRVAIARAIVNKPRVLLLDEPLSALDYRLRKQMQKELRELQHTLGITFVLVTHDQDEAFTMSDRVVVMNEGRIEQIGTPREIYEEPVNLYVAEFVGEINVLSGTVGSTVDGGYRARVEGSEVFLKTAKTFAERERVKVLLRPEDFRLEVIASAPQTGAAGLTGEVMNTFYQGATYDVEVRLDSGRRLMVTEFFDEDSETLIYRPGDRVAVTWFEGWEVVLTADE